MSSKPIVRRSRKNLGPRVMAQAMMGRVRRSEKTMAKIVRKRERQLSK